MSLNAPSNPHAADARACSEWVIRWIWPPKKYYMGASVDDIYWMARWAAHWGNLALKYDQSINADA